MSLEKTKVFLCYASEDKASVLEIYKRLKGAGLKPWLDKTDLLPGQVWSREIPKAIKKSDFVLIFFSNISVAKRGYVQKEFKLALEVLNEIPEGKIFIIPVRLDACRVPEEFHHLQYCDLFEDDGFEQVLRAIKPEQEIIEAIEPQKILRSRPLKNLSAEAVKDMLKEKDFFHVDWNRGGKGLERQYEEITQRGERLVVDHTTGLTWQQSGFDDRIVFKKVQDYIRKLNDKQFAGYSNWRPPTLEEAMSLVEPTKKNQNLHIDPVFDKRQESIWTADKEKSASTAWVVNFSNGYCDYFRIIARVFVRAVR